MCIKRTGCELKQKKPNHVNLRHLEHSKAHSLSHAEHSYYPAQRTLPLSPRIFFQFTRPSAKTFKVTLPLCRTEKQSAHGMRLMPKNNKGTGIKPCDNCRQRASSRRGPKNRDNQGTRRRGSSVLRRRWMTCSSHCRAKKGKRIWRRIVLLQRYFTSQHQ